MRILFSGLVAAGLLTSQMAAAAECTRGTEDPAFDVASLKNELMFVALTCHAEDQYNAFVARFSGELNSESKVVNGYFSRTYGRTATKQYDNFITTLANTQSQSGLVQGNRYCDHNMRVFDEVMALHGPAELPEYAAGRAALPGSIMAGCTATGTAQRAPARATRTAARRRS